MRFFNVRKPLAIKLQEVILKNNLLASRLGEEFEETTTDGRKCKTTVKPNNFHWAKNARWRSKKHILTQPTVQIDLSVDNDNYTR